MWDAAKVLVLAAVLGGAGLPVTRPLLAGVPGAGAGLARPLALLLAGFVVWLAVSVGVVPYTTLTAWAGLVVVLALGLLVSRREPGRADAVDRSLVLGAEVVFVAAFVLGCLLTSFAPDVVGTEKPMDMMLLDTSMTSTQLPPRDLWLAGEDLNYYYLGSWLVGFVMKLAGVAPDRGYNLGLGLVFALGASAVFGLAGSLAAVVAGRGRRRPVLLAAAAATGFTMLAGNLKGLLLVLEHDGPLRTLNWFGASRVTPGAADDFPFFATLLGDLHAHLIAVPFTLVVVGFALQAATAGPLGGSGERRGVVAARLAVTAVASGALAAMHTWTSPVALALLLSAGAVGTWRTRGWRVSATLSVVQTAHPLRRQVAATAAWGVAVLAGGLLAFLPFHLTFDPSPGGVGTVHDLGSIGTILERTALTHGVLVGIALLAAAAAAISSRRPRAPSGSTAFLWLLVAAGIGCLVVPNVVYVKDAFDGGPNYRFNTVFKFGFQAWPLLGVASGALVLVLARALPRRGRPLVVIAVAAAALACAAFPVGGSIARSDGFAGPARLGGLRWMERIAPGDLATIRWLRDHVPAGTTVLEATGPEYSYGGRIATFSGRATVVAWAGHELVWGQPLGTREADVAAIYSGADAAAARALLARYGVDYVVIGDYERKTYPGPGLATLRSLGPLAFASGRTAVYRVA